MITRIFEKLTLTLFIGADFRKSQWVHVPSLSSQPPLPASPFPSCLRFHPSPAVLFKLTIIITDAADYDLSSLLLLSICDETTAKR